MKDGLDSDGNHFSLVLTSYYSSKVYLLGIQTNFRFSMDEKRASDDDDDDDDAHHPVGMRGMFTRFGGPGGGSSSFTASYRAYPVTFIDRPQLEHGDKAILPPSALDRLTRMDIDDFPMTFSVHNGKEGKSTHCGVLEFVAEEGVVYLPYWMMQNLLLREGDVVKFTRASLPKGSYVKLQPQTKDFLDISNPKAVLETTLRSYTCLTVGDTFVIHYNNKKYYIDVVEAKPGNAVGVVDTDCEVDFAPPLDYVDPYDNDNATTTSTKFGDGNSGLGATTAPAPAGSKTEDEGVEKSNDDDAVKAKTFLAFAGSGNRLDGKAVTEIAPKEVEIPESSLNVTKEWQALRQGGVLGGETSKAPEEPNPDADIDRKRSGKVVFGGARAAAIARKKEKAAAAKKDENASGSKAGGDDKSSTSFQAFQGSGNKLR